MKVDLEGIRKHFAVLSDAALLETKRDDLVEAARGCYDEEVAKRGLNHPAEAPGTSAEAQPEGTPDEPDEMALIATYTVGDEASLARGLLEIAGIPVTVKTQVIQLSGYEIHLLVPTEFEEQALEVLGSEISDDDLAAQAEAAGDQ